MLIDRETGHNKENLLWFPLRQIRIKMGSLHYLDEGLRSCTLNKIWPSENGREEYIQDPDKEVGELNHSITILTGWEWGGVQL